MAKKKKLISHYSNHTTLTGLSFALLCNLQTQIHFEKNFSREEISQQLLMMSYYGCIREADVAKLALKMWNLVDSSLSLITCHDFRNLQPGLERNQPPVWLHIILCFCWWWYCSCFQSQKNDPFKRHSLITNKKSIWIAKTGNCTFSLIYSHIRTSHCLPTTLCVYPCNILIKAPLGISLFPKSVMFEDVAQVQ